MERAPEDKKPTNELIAGNLSSQFEPMYENLMPEGNLTFELFRLFSAEDALDFANTVTIDSQNKKRVAIGSEKGKMIIFDTIKKAVVAVLKGDIWINALELKGSTLFTVGSQKSLEAFNYRSGSKTFKMPSFTKDYEGFGSKGILVKNILNTNLIITNLGYSRVVIMDRHTKKILRKIDFCPNKLGNAQSASENKRLAILNHHFVQEKNILILLFRGDSNLYFFNLKNLTLIKRVKLFNYEELPSDMFLMNTEIVSHGGTFVAVILQFSYNKRKRGFNKTIFYYFDVEADKSASEAKISISFYHAIPLSKEVFISCDIIKMTLDHEVEPMRNVGYVLLLGTSQGEFLCQAIFTLSKTCEMTRWLKWKSNTEVTGLVRKCESCCYYLTADGNLTHIGWASANK